MCDPSRGYDAEATVRREFEKQKEKQAEIFQTSAAGVIGYALASITNWAIIPSGHFVIVFAFSVILGALMDSFFLTKKRDWYQSAYFAGILLGFLLSDGGSTERSVVISTIALYFVRISSSRDRD